MTFEAAYEEGFDFVWRNVRRLGVREASTADVVQEIFVVVHRKLPEFERRSSLTTWLFGITFRVVRDHLRSVQRKNPPTNSEVDAETQADANEPGPHTRLSRLEAARLVQRIVDELDDGRREVFLLAELEQMAVPDIATALGLNLNTVYSRLRAARQQFDEAVARHKARDGWRLR
jgi:RNA polymerase sigma-70 factor (ECF subfamily)